MKILISAIFLMIFVNSCGETNTGRDTGDTGNSGNTGNTQADVDSDTGDTCPDSNKFCHSRDDLNWSDVSSDSMYWDDAITYCVNLGGRLPTINELRTLIQNCPATESGGKCGVTDECLSYVDCYNDPCYGCEEDYSGKYSIFGDIYWMWSSSELSDIADGAWGVDFRDIGRVYGGNKDGNGNIRCVK